MSNTLSIDICICTFRRNHIRETLASLSHLDIHPEWNIRIIVADNDDTPSARENVNSSALQLPFEVLYIHAPARNISIARNACLEAAHGDLVAFLDDDETATSLWLKSLVEIQQREKAQAVLGPVNAIYSNHAPQWMQDGDFHSTQPVWVNGEIITGYTCNLLLDIQSGLFNDLRFSPALGKTGGEDTVFLHTLYKKGGKISYAETALLNEPVPEGRASLIWLIKRRFRSGQTHALLLMNDHGNNLKNKIFQIIKALLKAGACFSASILFLLSPSKRAKWILRGSLHVGVIARLIGKKELVQYG